MDKWLQVSVEDNIRLERCYIRLERCYIMLERCYNQLKAAHDVTQHFFYEPDY